MVESFDHLIDNQSDSLSVEFPISLLLEHIEQALLHQFKHHENMHAVSISTGFGGFLSKAAQELDNIGVTVK